MGDKQDRHCVRRKQSKRRKHFKGPLPQSEVVLECQKVFADNRPSVGNQGASLPPEVENHALSQAQVQTHGHETVFSGIPRLVNTCPAKGSILPHLDEQGNQFSFLEFFMTLMYRNHKIALQLRRLLLPTHKMRLLCNLKTWARLKVKLLQLKPPQACYNQTRTPKPSFPKSDCNYAVAWAPYGGM